MERRFAVLDQPMTHAKVKLPKSRMHATHPFNNEKNHTTLLEYLQQRLLRGKNARDSRVPRYASIDKGVAGWMRLSDEDRIRADKKERDGTPQALEINLPLSFVHLDDMMTYFAATFAPNRGMFYHTGDPDDVDQASQIVTLMNNHAIYAGYYREVLLGIYALLKYNYGGFHVYWAKEEGPKLVKDSQGNDQLTSEIRWQGNRLEAIDVYNFMCDTSVHPSRLHCDGEFSATAELRSHYWLQSKASQGVFFNCERALAEATEITECVYYRNPPAVVAMDQDESGGTNWKAILSGVDSSSNAGFELVKIFIKLNPTEFGLVSPQEAKAGDRDRYETWRFTILNDTYIIDATRMNNIHGYLPHVTGLMNDGQMAETQKSTAEILAPLQDFASFLMNTHVKATRKNLWGLTVYDPTAVDLKAIPSGEVSARIPSKPAAHGRNINEFIWEHGNTLETKQTLQDLEGVMAIIGQFFPTQSLPSQIASIDRAVDSQVAAVQQGANRRQQKDARLLDDSIFRQVRFLMYYNLIQYQPDESTVTDFYTGKPIQIDLNALRDTNLPFIIGQGLKAIDRQAAASMLQQIIFALIQAPQASQGIDLLGLIDYWTSMIDIDVDMKQFMIQQAQVGPDGQPIPGAEEALASGIAPATNPQALTTPIYGKSAT